MVLKVSEIFLSIQGESTYAGAPCIFIRLAGCNLECNWCDTAYARVTDGAEELSLDEIVNRMAAFRASLVEVTGGEPLVQSNVCGLLERLADEGYTVLLETNGSVDLSGVDKRVIKIVDIKCPSSGHDGSFDMANLAFIGHDDEIKFVINDEADYEFAKRFVEECVHDRTTKILFAPVRPGLEPSLLAEWILRDGLGVRLQLQVHKYIWEGEGRRGA
ncbi:MAG: radical SAM protein [Deltaproteobacteria bacterium]|nr:radical SAM protein [Deltaproteobacteria bacterium]